MKTRKLKITDSVYHFPHCVDTVSYEPSVLDGFSFSVIGHNSDGKPVYSLDRDISLLLDSKKVRDPSLQQVFLDMVSSARSQSAGLFDGYSDDQLLATIKSRYVQAPCELAAWSDWLKSNLQSIADSLPREEPVTEPVSDPVVDPANS